LGIAIESDIEGLREVRLYVASTKAEESDKYTAFNTMQEHSVALHDIDYSLMKIANGHFENYEANWSTTRVSLTTVIYVVFIDAHCG